MKQYRLKKRFYYWNGEFVDPQLLDTHSAGYETKDHSHFFYEFFVESNKEYFEEVKPERWKPEKGEMYFWADGQGYIQADKEEGFMGKYYYEYGNCFQTKAQAKEAAKRIKQTLMAYQDELMEAVK